MDKIGPICRSVEDCALVFDMIHGSDNRDGTVKDLPFNWDPDSDIHSLKIGYVESSFAKAHPNDQATLKKLREMGLNLVSIQLPDYPVETMEFILSVEAAAAFDELTRSNQDDLLTRQTKDAWPNIFRRARMIPAVEYVQANRLRWQVMDKMAELMSDIDLYVAPSFDSLLLTNLTGHPCVVLPNGFEQTNSSDVVPTSISFIGQLYGKAKLMTAAKAYQDITGFHLNYPQP